MKHRFVFGLLVASLMAVSAGLAQAAGDAAAGKLKADTCMGCHGVPTLGSVYPTYHVPKLAGQHADYLVVALQAYKTGLREHPTMHAQAVKLSDEDMADIAAWFAQAGN